MFLCENCLHVIEFGPCHWCGSESYADAVRCVRCGDWCAAHRVREGLCPNCRRAVWQAFEEGFSEQERAYIALRI